MGQVLVLNASYEPLNITTWRRAMVMMLKGKAESLEQDSTREIRRGTHLPTVIRLRQFVRVPFRQLPLTRRNLFHRDNHSCQYCGCRNEPLSIDHVVPRSRGGGDTWENVTTDVDTCIGDVLSEFGTRKLVGMTWETLEAPDDVVAERLVRLVQNAATDCTYEKFGDTYL